jgi:hypothetical protein
MPRQKPVRVLLVDEDWIYELSALNAESKLLEKHSDKIHQLHYDKLQKLVGRCFVDELVNKKKATDSADKTSPSEEEDWTDKIDKKYLEVLEHQDFRAWYAKTLEYLVTLFSTGEFKADGLVKYERDLEDVIVRNVSARERKERQDSVLRYLPTLDINLMEHVVKPNVLLFSCLKKKFQSADKVQKFELDTFNPVIGGNENIEVEPVIHQMIVVDKFLLDKTKATYNYIASPLDGSFTIDYDDEIDTNGQDIEPIVYNSLGQKLDDIEWTDYSGEYIKIWITDYQTTENLTGTITIQVI